MTDADLGAAYDAAAAAWADGPDALYDDLAGALVAACGRRVQGARVLDVGAGTGVAARAAARAGAARVVAVDLAAEMLRRGAADCAPVVADARHLPFPDGAVDLVLAALVLSHLPDPRAALREARRVGRALAASAFAAGWTHPAKDAVDRELQRRGFQAPAWHDVLKRHGEPKVADPAALGALARAAGWESVRVDTIAVPTRLRTASALVSWRLGMAHVAPFVASLHDARRSELRRDAEAALMGAPPLVVPIVVLTATRRAGTPTS